MTLDADTKTAEEQRTEEAATEAATDAAFAEGAAMETGKRPAATPKPEAKPEPKPEPKPAAAAPAAVAKPVPPEYVRVTKDQLASLTAAAAKTASHEAQMAKAFGTIGNMQKVLTTLQSATPRGGKVEIPKDAFADMERDFPELAASMRAGLEATLRGMSGTGPANAEADPEQLQRLISEHSAKVRSEAEIESLEDEHPDWRTIVGVVDISKEKPDPNNAYRKWLATKDAAYQAKLNGTNSAAVISRSISRFQAETKAAPAAAGAAPSLKAQLQAARIRGAVQPRGDGGQPAPASDDDQFAAGFASG
jgi:hypothetical protein